MSEYWCYLNKKYYYGCDHASSSYDNHWIKQANRKKVASQRQEEILRIINNIMTRRNQATNGK